MIFPVGANCKRPISRRQTEHTLRGPSSSRVLRLFRKSIRSHLHSNVQPQRNPDLQAEIGFNRRFQICASYKPASSKFNALAENFAHRMPQTFDGRSIAL